MQVVNVAFDTFACLAVEKHERDFFCAALLDPDAEGAGLLYTSKSLNHALERPVLRSCASWRG